MSTSRAFVISACFLFLSSALSDEAETARLINQVRSIGPKGENHKSAVMAAAKLQQSDMTELTQIIRGMEGANPLATNWLRGIAEQVASQHVRNGGKLPLRDLHALFSDTRQAPRGRRLAFELIASVDSAAEGRLIPGLQTDPSLELRYDAIRLAIDQAAAKEKEGNQDGAREIYGRAFFNARDIKQTKHLAAKLKELGVSIDMPTRMGFITHWHVIGPFENGSEKGWDVAYPPEKEVDFLGEYEGQKGRVKWMEHSTQEEFGLVDLNKVLGEHKGAIAYAATEFISDKDQTVDIRIGCINANKVWVNGGLVAANHVYHTGMEIDQYGGQVKLKKGTNIILVKIGQNEQTEDWAKFWQFQLRVCDSLGGPILSEDRVIPKTASR
jgi:hypothetical protein